MLLLAGTPSGPGTRGASGCPGNMSASLASHRETNSSSKPSTPPKSSNPCVHFPSFFFLKQIIAGSAVAPSVASMGEGMLGLIRTNLVRENAGASWSRTSSTLADSSDPSRTKWNTTLEGPSATIFGMSVSLPPPYVAFCASSCCFCACALSSRILFSLISLNAGSSIRLSVPSSSSSLSVSRSSLSRSLSSISSSALASCSCVNGLMGSVAALNAAALAVGSAADTTFKIRAASRAFWASFSQHPPGRGTSAYSSPIESRASSTHVVHLPGRSFLPPEVVGAHAGAAQPSVMKL